MPLLDNEKFIVQKSDNGELFSDVGILDGAGNSSEENSYRFLDTKIGEPVNFYRIVFIDSDGNRFHTPTVVVSREKSNNFVSITPLTLVASPQLLEKWH